jgi:predicted nucleic acid-binding protein
LIYLDASALVKLVIAEDESPGLSRWLSDRPNLARVSSPLVRVEVLRAVWRADPAALAEGYRVMDRIREVRLTDRVLSRAVSVRPVTVRAIDAVHLASAQEIREELTEFVAYDKRLLDAARSAGLPTASPA